VSDAANDGTPTPAPAAQAAAAMGGMMMGESSPFPDDPDVPDHSDDIASIFGLGEEAGPTPNSSESQPEGGASPSGATPAAEGGGEQAQPATPPTPQPTPGQQGDQSQAPAQPQAPAAPPAAPVQPSAPAPDQTVAALTAQVNALIAHTAQLQAQLAQGGAQPQAGTSDQQGQPQPPADPYMDYRIAIPDDVANAVFNEDPNIARSGMAHLINSMGRIIHERVVKSMTDIHLPQQLQRFESNLTLTQQQQQMRNDYFKDFPQHNDPATRLIVAQEAETMWRTNPTMDWDANSRAALGQRVNARLGAGVAAAPVVQPMQQQPTAQPAPRPAAQMGASTRPAPTGQDEGNFIHDILTA
jgi:hypothetical protein